MPRNGAGIFSLDARYLVSEGDTILPSQHNPVLEDLQTDANTPRPIVAGGTGASTATTARTNLSVYSIADVDDGFTPKVATRTALKALDTATTKAVVLTEASRQKLFMWMTGDYTDSVAGDPSELAYIPADGIDPALGCWVAVTGAGASIVPVIQGGTGANDAATALDNLGGMAKATYDPNGVSSDAFDMANMVEATDAKIMTAAERTKLGGIEAGADVTDAANVDAAGATMNTDTDVSGNSWVLDEDDMASDSAAKVPTQQSVKAYADAISTLRSSASNIAYLAAGTGAVSRTVANKLGEWVSVKDFGAVGDGTTDDTDAIQAAVDYLETLGGGFLYFPHGIYLISATIAVAKGIHIIGEGVADDSTLAAGSNDKLTTLRWDSAATGTVMVNAISGTANAFLRGGAIGGIQLDGNNTATVGFRGRSISNWDIDLIVRKVTNVACWIEDGNGVLSQFNEISLDFTYGSAAEVEGATGLLIDGTASNVGVTQNIIRSVSGLHKNGDMVRITDADNNIFGRIHASRASGGTGYGLRFANGNTNHARNNLVHYMTGHVYAASQTRGNEIRHMISEAGSVTIASGALLHYEVTDYVTGAKYRTHTYRMSDVPFVGLGNLVPDGTVAVGGVAALVWGCREFPDGSTGRVRGSFGIPFDWGDGTITGLRLVFSTDTANTSKFAYIQAQLHALAVGESISTPAVDESFSVSVNNTVNRLNVIDLEFSTALDYTAGDFVPFVVSRLGVNASDTMSGKWQLIDLAPIFVGDGPNSAGSGPFDVGPDYV